MVISVSPPESGYKTLEVLILKLTYNIPDYDCSIGIPKKKKRKKNQKVDLTLSSFESPALPRGRESLVNGLQKSSCLKGRRFMNNNSYFIMKRSRA